MEQEEKQPEVAADDVAEPETVAEAPERIVQLEEELAETRSALQRMKADFENYRRRMLQEQARWTESAVGDFVATLLPAIDNLERALAAVPAEPVPEVATLKKGVEMTHRQLLQVLDRAGVRALDPLGAAFDPALHEALSQVAADDAPPGHVVQVFEKGYQFKERLLRPARVAVAQQDQSPEEAPQ